MAVNTLPLLTIVQFVSFSTAKDDEWVDYTDMLRYDPATQSMRQDDPCAKCYKIHGLWAPLQILKHAPLEDLLKLGLTILLIVLVPLVALLRRRGRPRDPNSLPPVSAPQQMTQNDDDGEDDSEGEDDNTEAFDPGDLNQHKQNEDNPTEATEYPAPLREESDNDHDNASVAAGNDSDAHSLEGSRPNMEGETPNDQYPPEREGGDGSESDSEKCCSFRESVQETMGQT